MTFPLIAWCVVGIFSPCATHPLRISLLVARVWKEILSTAARLARTFSGVDFSSAGKCEVMEDCTVVEAGALPEARLMLCFCCRWYFMDDVEEW